MVIVITGADKNKTEPKRVISVNPDETKPTVIVEGVNIKTRHIKPNAQSPQGSIVKKEGPISLSNVMLWDTTAKAGTKIKRERKDGKAIRVSKKSGEVIK